MCSMNSTVKSQESDEAARYMTFYPITEWPHVSIVDPRTGENMVTWSRLDAAAFPTLITEFLSLHPSLESPGKEEPPRKKVKTDVLVEMDEEAQMAAAIKASLADTLKEDKEDSGSDLETFSDEDSNLQSSDTRSPVRNGAGVRQMELMAAVRWILRRVKKKSRQRIRMRKVGKPILVRREVRLLLFLSDGLMETGKVGLKQPHQSLQLSCSTYRRKATLLNLMRWSLTFPEESFTL